MAMPLELFGGKNCFFLFDLHSKNSSGNICQNVTLILLKFVMLSKLQEYVKNIYYVGLKHETLCFQFQFTNLLFWCEEMKVINSKVAFREALAINAELKKKNHQSKLSAQTKSSVAKEEKLKKMQT